MYNKMSQGKRRHVLEDVFWVPVSNCKSRHSSSHIVREVCAEKLDTSKASSSGDVEIITTHKPTVLMIHSQQEFRELQECDPGRDPCRNPQPEISTEGLQGWEGR